MCVSDTCSWNTPADSPALPAGVLPVGVQIEEARRTHTEEGGRERRKRENYKGDHLLKANQHRPMR